MSAAALDRPVHHQVLTRSSRRAAAAAAALLGVALFTTVAVVNVPHEAGDAELLQWWQQSGNRRAGLWSGLSALVVAFSLPVVLSHVCALGATAGAPRWTELARSAGAAATALWLVTGAARATVGHLVDVMGEPLPDVDVLRFATALNYTLLGLSGMAALGACVLAVSVVALRTGALAPWFGRLSAACAVLVLGAVLAQYGAYATPVAVLWALALAVAVWREPADRALSGAQVRA